MADKTIDPNMKVGMPSLGARIRSARVAAGYSQEALAAHLSVSWMTVHRWEHDRRAIRYGHLVELSKHCGVDIQALVPGMPSDKEI